MKSPPTTRIPHISSASININSLSANATNPASTKAKRHNYVIKTINNLLKSHDILFIQETHLPLYDGNTLALNYPDHTIFYNNGKKRRAGTLVMINNSLKSRYYFCPRALDEAAIGHVQVVRLMPRELNGESSTCHPLQLINFYLPASSHRAKRAALTSLLSLHRHRNMYTIAMGDFNFIEHPEDHSPRSDTQLLDRKTRRLWQQVTKRLRLTELTQPTHTHYFVSDSLDTTRTSRIDRVYTSYSTADSSIVHPRAYIPHLPNSKVDSYERLLSPEITPTNSTGKSGTAFSSDHLPIAVRFAPPDSTRRPYRAYAPKWLAAHPDARRRVSELWHRDDGSGCPYKDLRRWKLSVQRYAKLHFQERAKAEKAGSRRTSSLSAAISVYRACTRLPFDNAHLSKLLSAHTDLADLLDSRTNIYTGPDTARIHEHITSLIIHNATTASAPVHTSARYDSEPEGPADQYPPPPKAPAQGRNHSPIDQIKGRMPTLRKGLRHLRASSRDAPTSDPEQMGAIAKKEWGAIWKKRPTEHGSKDINKYLQRYATRFPTGTLGDLPALEDMEAAIRETNNSSPGPDGIPFAYYRLCSEDIAPVLLRILKLLASGRTPPAGFNYATLFLLPKDDSMLINHTRPISVTNADNRIIAKLLASLLGPIFNKILHMSQKGFIPKRCGLDHVRLLTAALYGADEKKAQRYILLLDTKKAFDSIDHQFITAILKKLNVPPWIRRTIHGLMTNVMVHPSFATKKEHSIPISRGVKQGCPLSPLLFALCYDALLCYLAESVDAGAFAFADDLALDSDKIGPILDGLAVIKLFSRYSGLGLNIDKTVVLTARPPSPRAKALLRLWYPDIKFVLRAKYLGVLLGTGITTEDIFRVAVDKFFSRSHQLQPLISSSPLHQRILIYNIFLLPILYYLAQFYIIPYSTMVVPIREHCRKAIGAFNGGAFAYCHLINRPHGKFGPHTALRDLWATNMTLLASRVDLTASHGHGFPQMGDYDHLVSSFGDERPSFEWGSLIIAEHEAYCAWKTLYDHGKRDRNKMLVTDHLTGSISTRRRLLYLQLIREGYWQERDTDSSRFKASLPRKLRRFFPSASPARMRRRVRQLKSNLKSAGNIPKAGQWNTWFRFVTNALPTDCRLASAGIFPTNRRADHRQRCFFCGTGKDDLRHIFGDCAPVAQALRACAHQLQLQLPASATTLGLATLTVAAPTTPSPLFSVFIFTFVWAVWSERRRYFSALDRPPTYELTVARLTEYAITHLPQPRTKRSTPTAVVEMANNPPTEAIVGFSDGSAIPNPGPCGAGALLFCPHDAGSARSALSLGEGDNNVGEIAGLHQVLRLVDEAYVRKIIIGNPPLLLFTDSLLVVGALEWGWAMKNMPRSIRPLLKSYRLRKAANPTSLYWVKGHSKIKNNDVVDVEAKTGASWSTQGGPRRTRTTWDIPGCTRPRA